MITDFNLFENISNFNNKDYAMKYDKIDSKYNNFYSSCASSLIDFANINKGDLVLELGSGTGFSTIELIKVAGNNVIATEYGDAMFNILKSKVDNAYKLDARDIRKFTDKMNLENKLDVVFSNFTYFYFYGFEEILFKDIWEKCLKSGGKYAFNITNFLTHYRYGSKDYNNFYFNVREGFNNFLIKNGIKKGVGEDKIVGDSYSVKRKLYLSGFSDVVMKPHEINILPSEALDFMIDNFYSFGFDVSWSTTINEMPIDKKIYFLKKGNEYIKNKIDKNGEKPTIMNVVAYKL